MGGCKGCRFYNDAPGRTIGGDVIEGGDCRRRAPSVRPHPHIHDQWPRVKPDDWCGEFGTNEFSGVSNG